MAAQPGLVIDSRICTVPNLNITNFYQYPELALQHEDVKSRYAKWIRSIILHTTKGKSPVLVKMGAGKFTGVGSKVARFWSTCSKVGGAHLVVDLDGSITCHADLSQDSAQHAGNCNSVSIGIEIYQTEAGEVYDEQLNATVALLDYLTLRFGIQRQIPPPEQKQVIYRCTVGGKDVVGIYGHRNVTTDRGPGDPGASIFDKLVHAGYECFKFQKSEDIHVWKERQIMLGFSVLSDGIPGKQTVAALAKKGYLGGLWVKRPNDQLYLDAIENEQHSPDF